MACKDMNRIIDDIPVFVRQWPASIALENLSEALGLLGPNFSFFVDGSYSFGDILAVMHSTDSKKLNELVQKFVLAARLNGQDLQPAQFNQFYNGELLRVFKVFSMVAEVNYLDFFEQGLPPPKQEPAEQEKPQLELPEAQEHLNVTQPK